MNETVTNHVPVSVWNPDQNDSHVLGNLDYKCRTKNPPLLPLTIVTTNFSNCLSRSHAMDVNRAHSYLTFGSENKQWGKQTYYGPVKGQSILSFKWINGLMSQLIHWLIKERECWAVICGKWITNYINKTDHPSGFLEKSSLQRILFDKSCLQRISFQKKIDPRRIFSVEIHLLNHSVVNLISCFLLCLQVYW